MAYVGLLLQLQFLLFSHDSLALWKKVAFIKEKKNWHISCIPVGCGYAAYFFLVESFMEAEWFKNMNEAGELKLHSGHICTAVAAFFLFHFCAEM